MKIISRQCFVLCSAISLCTNVNVSAQSTSLIDLVEQKQMVAVMTHLKSLSSKQLTAELEMKSSSGDTVLLIAARNGDLDLFGFLLALGANINALDSNRRDVLNIAIKTKKPAIG